MGVGTTARRVHCWRRRSRCSSACNGKARDRREARDPLNLARLALERVAFSCSHTFVAYKAASAGSPLAPGPLAFPVDPRPCMERPARTRRRFRLAAGVVNVEPAAADSAAPDTAADAGAKSAKSAQRKSAMDAYAAQTGREQKLRGRKSRR